MQHPCNKCRGEGWYRTDPDGNRLTCSRCQGTGKMNQLTKTERKQRKEAKRLELVTAMD